MVGRGGGGLEYVFPADTGLVEGFSGLLGGVLKGETWSSDDARSVRGANELVSGFENMAGLAGIFGFSPRLAGGGSDALLSFRSAGLPRPFTSDRPGDSRSTDWRIGTDDPSCGDIGRAGGAGDTSADTDSRER